MDHTDMNEPLQSIADLSPEKRGLLERRLMEMGLLAPGEPGIPRRDHSAPCPLSFAQQRLWFLDQLEPNSCVYNIAMAVRLRGTLQVEVLRKALDAVVARHEALRTTVSASDDEPLQMVAERWSMELSVIDASAAPDAEREAGLEHVLRAEARRPFNLAADLMLRALLVRLGVREHVLLLTMHHIASDGWSLGILTRELTALYTALSQKRPPALPPLPIQYGDYAVWQRQWLRGAELAAQLAYWKGRLAGAPPMLPLPTDRPRPAAQTYEGAQESLRLSRGLTDALHALSRRERATLFMTLLGAFQTLLHRYTGQDDVVVGTAIAGRRRVETEPLIGFFVNTLALRADLSGDPSFREVLGRVRETVLGAYDHQDLPFEKLVEEARPERSLSWAPLVQVMLVLQAAGQPSLELPGLTVSPVAVDTGTAKFDLTASVTEGPQGLTVTLEYNTDLYDAATIRRMLGHYEMLLQGIVADPEQRLSQFPLLTAAERHQLLVEWNATQAPYPADACIHELFEAQVRRTPEAVAVTFETQSLIYRQLNQRANQLARYLQKLGVGPDVLVGLCCERSFDMVVGLLGILKAGGAYVPLDPTDPQERLAFVLRDARVSVLVTQQHLLPTLPGSGVTVVCLDTHGEAIAQEDQEDSASPATAENMSYVIYTSGSTGRPKGVMVPHRAVCNLMSWFQTVLPMNSTDVMLQKTPLTFDNSVGEIFQPLLVGARLVLARPEGHRDCRYLIETIRAARVSQLKLVPSLMRAIVEEPGLEACTSLRHVTCGGEALSRRLLERFRARLDVDIVNMYGPTETTVNATFWVSGQDGSSDVVPIGRPLANTQVHILDAHMQPVPIGVPGELYIGGAGVARGYLGRPELTAERFLPNPFSGEGEVGARLYRSGDVGRYLPDGNIDYLGRRDHQVKIRGFRIELGEIEAALREHPDVRESVVVVREDTPGEKRLVAYVVPHQAAAPTVDGLRHFVRTKLPEYMVPSAFVLLSFLPVTSSGKVDRSGLPPPDTTRPGLEYVAPRDAMELRLAQIWEVILGVHPVGVTADFFELGGHSLLAVRLINAIEREVGRRLPLSTLFAGATIQHLAQAILQQPTEADGSSVTMLHPEGSRRPFFFLSGDYVGAGFYCRTLSRVLGPEQPFVVLHAHRVDGRPVPASIQAMATDRLATLRALQPHGPYLLGGYCNGGVVAFEMAQRLQGQGERVDLLVLLDTPAHTARFGTGIVLWLVNCLGTLGGLTPQERLERFARVRRWSIDMGERAAYYRHLLRELSGSNLDDRIALVKRITRRGGEKLAGMFWRRGKRPARSRLEILGESYGLAIAGYIPQRYAGGITLFRTANSGSALLDLGWRGLARQVEVHMIPGDHHTCVTQHAAVLGELLSICLRKVPPK